MPVYTYRCKECGFQFDYFQKFSDQPLSECPECNKQALRKVYMPVGIVFKGSGFYATDHKSPSGAGRTASGNTKAEDKDGKSESSAEEKSGEKRTESAAKTD